MLELRVSEEYNGLIPLEEISMDEIKSHFNEAFLNAFTEIFPDPAVLVEFTYAIDLLIEMAKLPGFPQDRMLDNCDIKPNVANALKWVGLLTHTRSLIGVAVSNEVKERITEFFEDGYPKLLDNIFTQMRTTFLTFELDGIQHHLIYYRDHASVTNLNTFRLTWEECLNHEEVQQYVVCLPFNSKRTR